MTTQKSNAEKELNFVCNAKFEIAKHDQTMIDLINYPNDKSKKVKALVEGCIKRNNKLLYKGQKYFIQDLQLVLSKFPDITPQIMRNFNMRLNKTTLQVNVQCHNCANYTEVWKYCPTCENVHFCQQGCEMKIKFTHQRQQCRIRPFPKIYKALQVQIHVGSDLGRNVHLSFQHQVSMSLLLRGQKLLQSVVKYFTTTEGNTTLDNYHVKNENKMLKFEKQIKNPHVGNQKVPLQNIEEISALYTNNRILLQLQLFLYGNGAILWKNIREIHDNHFREIFIFHYS